MTILTLEFLCTGDLPLDLRGVVLRDDLIIKRSGWVHLPVRAGNKIIRMGEICKISWQASRKNHVEVLGSSRYLHHLGEGASTEIVIHGDVGRWAGVNSNGAVIWIDGDAGEGLGAGMISGEIVVAGSAGDGCGAINYKGCRMSGGLIHVKGNAGDHLGQGMRRGMIIVEGNSGNFTGEDMIAGTIVVAKSMGFGTGINMRRGSLVTGNIKAIPAGFKFAGIEEVGWLNILERKLEEKAITIKLGMVNRQFRRYTGDHLALGKGELILHEPS